MMPHWLQNVAQFIPATYLVSGIARHRAQHETLATTGRPSARCADYAGLATFIATRLFRWEKEEKLRPSAKLWVLGVLTPFVVLGVYQFQTSDQIVKNRVLWRQLQRDERS